MRKHCLRRRLFILISFILVSSLILYFMFGAQENRSPYILCLLKGAERENNGKDEHCRFWYWERAANGNCVLCTQDEVRDLYNRLIVCVCVLLLAHFLDRRHKIWCEPNYTVDVSTCVFSSISPVYERKLS